MDEKPIADAKELSLESWLKIILMPEEDRTQSLYPDYCFPSTEHRDLYLAKIKTRDPREVRNLIRAFLMKTGCLGGDFDGIMAGLQSNLNTALKSERVRRAATGGPVWEGITWVLDLLHRPRMAVQVIQGYLAAHFWSLPDWRINGLFDAIRVIKAAYLEPLPPRDELLSVSPRDFEILVAHLFERMHFEVSVTQQTADGGFDVRLHRDATGTVESSVVECKRYRRNVPVKEIRALLGVVERDGLTRGLLVTTAGFTRAARSEASLSNRIELIDFPNLCSLLNAQFGHKWTEDIDRIVISARRQLEKRPDEAG